MSKRPPNFEQFLVAQRTEHSEPSYFHIHPIAQSPPADQLLAALGRNDQAVAAGIVSASSANELRPILKQTNLSAFIYDRLCALELTGRLEQLSADDGRSLLELLRLAAANASARFMKNDLLLAELRSVLDAFGPKVIWLKGTALSRTLYDEPSFRLSVDFDIFVSWQVRQEVIDALRELRFTPIWSDPGHCHQYGIGPVGTIDKLAIRPSKHLELCHNLTVERKDTPYIELKFEPLETGLHMHELARFESDSQPLLWNGSNMHIPSDMDHLLLQLTHFHKHSFIGWQWTYDIHLLASRITNWSEFVRRCKLEGVETSAWASLTVVSDRMSTPVPNEVFEELQLRTIDSVTKHFTFTSEMEFLWNTASIVGLLQNTFFLDDLTRKRAALRDCVLPSKQFLADYYCAGKPISPLALPFLMLVHWLVLLMPGGLTRRTIGQLIGAWQVTNV